MLVWNEYNCKVSGGTYKFVECEDCKQKYVYQMMREAHGQGSSLYFLDNAGASRRAQSKAHAEMQKALETDCDPVPCPKCGAYQQDMMAKMCREYRMWMFWVGVFTIFFGVLLGAFGFMFFSTDKEWLGIGLGLASLLAIGGGIALMVVRKQMGAAFEPNDLPLDYRLAEAEKRATKVRNFEHWLKDQGVDLDQRVEKW